MFALVLSGFMLNHQKCRKWRQSGWYRKVMTVLAIVEQLCHFSLINFPTTKERVLFQNRNKDQASGKI